MTSWTWTESDTAKAEQIWSEYQEQHDLSTCIGKTAGIAPKSDRVWIGESIQDVLSQRNADKIDSLLFFERIGSKTNYRIRRSAMIAGIVSDDGVPAIAQEIAGHNWLAIIDTGFNGDLELPEELRGKLNDQPAG